MISPSFSIPFSSIVFGPRTRDDKKYGNIEELAKSLQRLGTIQPIVLSGQSNGDNILIAGGRRFRAMELLKIEELWHGSTLDPFKLGFVWAHEVPEDVRREAELEENIRRLNFDWVDEQLTIASLHEAKTRAKLKWTMEQTAKLLGYDSRFPVHLACKITDALKRGDEEVRGCKDISAVIALFSRRKEEEALKETQKRFQQVLQPKEQKQAESFIDLVGGAPKENVPFPSIPTISLSSMFRTGDSIDLMRSLPDASFSHIITDIPYGIDMDNMDGIDVEVTKKEHDVTSNIELMHPFLKEAFRLCKPHGFCCFFFDLDHLHYLQIVADLVGWKVQRWPIIIHKTSPCKNSCAQYNTTKNYEALLYLRRDEHTVLRRAVASSVRSYDFFGERALYTHPFYKPSAAWKDIFDDVSFAGQSVLDPFCGELSGARAAIANGLVPSGFDLESNHILRGLLGVKAAYEKVFGEGKVRFT